MRVNSFSPKSLNVCPDGEVEVVKRRGDPVECVTESDLEDAFEVEEDFDY